MKNNTYTATIDGGTYGETTIQARGLKSALKAAIKWAKSGDWFEDGTGPVNVEVTSATGESLDDTIEVN